MTIEDLKARLTDVKERQPGKWIARCPCTSNHKNGDKTPSFEFGYDSKTQKILVHCHAGCTVSEICAALGITQADLMPPENDKRQEFLSWYARENGLTLETVYSYCYDCYNDGLAKVRFRKADGSKDFRWIKADPNKKSGYAMTHQDCPNRLYVRGDLRSGAVFVVEGEKDADNLYRLTGYTTVCTENGATKGDAGSKWRDEYTAQLAGKAVYVLWDNDEAGRNFAGIEAAALHGNAANVFMMDLLKVWPECPDKGDVSDMIKALGQTEAGRRLSDLMDQAEPWTDGEEQRAPADSTAAVADFLDKVTSKAFEPIPTGIKEIDAALCGGFVRQTLVTLGASPGAGKTILAQQIFEGIAKSGRADVLYFNLEMSVEQLIARSLSRETGIPQLEVLQGYRWTQEQEYTIRVAAQKYRDNIAPHIAYNPPDQDGNRGSAFYQDIVATMRAEAAARDPARPLLVVIDYLQLLRSRDGKADDVETIKAALKAFKDFAIECNAVVFLIMAHSRAVNQSGAAIQGAGRDTSAIEYSGDLQLSLNYARIVDGTYKDLADMETAIKTNRDGADEKTYNARALVVTKNRFGRDRARAEMVFIGEESRFSMVDVKHKEEPKHKANRVW